MSRPFSKKRRCSTGGTADPLPSSYAQVAADRNSLNDQDKLVQKFCSLETITADIQLKTDELDQAYDTIEQLGIQVNILQERTTKSELRVVDLEARS